MDTSVWSLALRRKSTASLGTEEQRLKAELVQAIHDGRVAMLGFLRQELLSGIQGKDQFDKVKAALDPYLDETVDSADHEYAAQVFNECWTQGVEAGTVDMLLCAVAVRRGWELLSLDSGLNRCMTIARKFHQKQASTRRASRQ